MKFADIRKIAFDTETTSPDPNEARIVTAALVVRGGGRDDVVMSWLINPGVPIPKEAAEIHGIDDAKAAEGADPKEALDDIADRLAAGLRYGMPVVAYNLAFDWTVLTRELARHHLPSVADRLPGIRVPALIDPHVIDKQCNRYVRGTGQRKLKPTCELRRTAGGLAHRRGRRARRPPDRRGPVHPVPAAQLHGPGSAVLGSEGVAGRAAGQLAGVVPHQGNAGTGRRPGQGDRRLMAADPRPAGWG